MTSNLPNWPGAKAVYSKAYRRLGEMAANGHITQNRHRMGCSVSAEMTDLIDALNDGNEERIKAILMFPNYSA